MFTAGLWTSESWVSREQEFNNKNEFQSHSLLLTKMQSFIYATKQQQFRRGREEMGREGRDGEGSGAEGREGKP